MKKQIPFRNSGLAKRGGGSLRDAIANYDELKEAFRKKHCAKFLEG